MSTLNPDRSVKNNRLDSASDCQGVRSTPSVPAAGAAQGAPDDEPMRRALVIDDEEAVRGVLRRWLVRRGWTVTEAANGAAARAQLERTDVSDAETSFDLVICDLRMPTWSGQALHAWVTEHRPALLDRLVFASGDVREAQVAEFLQCCGCPVLEKPFEFQALEAIIASR